MRKMTKYGTAWYKRICAFHIIRKYERDGYTSLDKLAEWNRLFSKQRDEHFICKKEYRYINPLDEREG